MNSLFWTLSIVLMLAGGAAVGASLASRSYEERRHRYRGKATATVVEIEADEPDREGQAKGIHDYYYAVFAYYAAGRLYKKRCYKGGNPCPFVLNQKIEIRYDEEKPDHFRIFEKNQINYLSMGLYYGGMGICLLGGFLFLLAAIRFF